MKKLPYILFGGLVVAGAGIYFYFQYKNKKNPLLPSTPSATTKSTPQINATTKPQAVASQLIPANNPVINYDGTLSGTVASPNSSTQTTWLSTGTATATAQQTIDPAYALNLQKANTAFQQLMVLKDKLMNLKIKLSGMTPPRVGYASSGSPFYSITKTGIYTLEAKEIPAKEKEILNLGFKVIGNQLFAI